MTHMHILGMPIGILTVNWIGSALMGVLIGYIAHTGTGHNYSLQLMVATGFLGGLTTFSSFALDIVNLMQNNNNGTAIVYVLLSVIGSVVLLLSAMWLTKVVLNG